MLEQLNRRRNELLRELKAVDTARQAFMLLEGNGTPKTTMSAAHRKKLSIAAKKRWAERKKKSG
jgi:hypothetical protein